VVEIDVGVEDGEETSLEVAEGLPLTRGVAEASLN
jgi:hypothetical protein